MRHIEDEDVRPVFDKVWNDFCEAGYLVRNYVHLAELFFQAGRDSLAREFWTARPKRTISRLVIGSQGNLLALSSDGRLYGLREFDGTNLPEWLPYAELPQEE